MRDPGDNGTHLHLWCLPDGTGLHAPYGALVVEDDTGRLCCHFCGRWFTSLGSHVRAHGTTAERYRADLGLCRREPLTAKPLSSAISARQQQAYATSSEVRERFAVGQQMARDGTLGRLLANGRSTKPPAPAAVSRQRQALETGRATVTVRRQAARAALVEESGEPDLATYLRTRYSQGASLERLAKDTGLGRDRLRDAMVQAGIETRESGANTAVGKRSRAVAAEEAAARRVGVDNLRGWLSARRAEGWTLHQLGTAVGHSGHWVSWRLDTDPTSVGNDSEASLSTPGAERKVRARIVSDSQAVAPELCIGSSDVASL